MLKSLARLVADTALVALLLFSSAGTLAWWRGWVLLAVMLCIRTFGAIAVSRVNPELVRERAGLPIHEAQSVGDRWLLLGVLATGFLGLPIVAGLDVFRWHAPARPTAVVAGLGLVLFALGWSLKSLALRANAFAIAVVRVHSERAHAVADSGPYRIVRHPFYAADPLILVGLGLWLQSYLAAMGAVVPLVLMVTRLRMEERFLQRELPGYTDYVARVRFRIIPGVW
jgi:protein-S-isoprenylcysteine O-methyltransferase Ste14